MDQPIDLIKETRELNNNIESLIHDFFTKARQEVERIDLYNVPMPSKLGHDIIVSAWSVIKIS